MKRQRFIRHGIAILAITFTLHSSTQKCDCKSASSSSSSSTPAPPPNPQLTVRNQYGVPIAFEVWTGTNLEYKEGTVLGNSLSKVSSSTALANTATSSGVTISYGGSFILVVGVQDGADYIYVTSQVVGDFTSNRMLTLDSTGSIN